MFEDNAYNDLLKKIGFKGSGVKSDISKVIVSLIVCWLPLLVITIIKGTFWTGDISRSFITDFDIQARFLVTLPIFILADRMVSSKLALIIAQFINSGIVGNEIREDFELIIKSKTRFLRSKWTNLAILALCYLQVFLVLFYESSSTSLLSWQVMEADGETSLNLAGKWFILISGPFLLFLFYRWLFRIIVWGILMYNISRLKLTLFPMHPDLAGSLGFLGYSIRYFSPVALAISATVAGTMADFMLAEGLHLADVRFSALGYFILMTLLFTLPLFVFSNQLINAREKSVYENYDYTNGIYRELRKEISKGHNQVTREDLKLPDFSAAADLSAVIENSLKMKFIPFTIKDLIPLWIMMTIPFLGVILIEIPVTQILQSVVSLLM
jgi:hypothetical protein